MPVRDICTDDAILFMWATFPNLPEALKVLTAWGFIYKTAAFVWVKQNKKNAHFVSGWRFVYQSKCRSLFARCKQRHQSKKEYRIA